VLLKFFAIRSLPAITISAGITQLTDLPALPHLSSSWQKINLESSSIAAPPTCEIDSDAIYHTSCEIMRGQSTHCSRVQFWRGSSRHNVICKLADVKISRIFATELFNASYIQNYSI